MKTLTTCGLAALAAALAGGAVFSHQSSAAAERERIEAQAHRAGTFRAQACVTRVMDAVDPAAGLIDDIQWRAPDQEPRITARARWDQATPQQQQQAAEAFACVLNAGREDRCIDFTIRHKVSDRALGRMQGCKFSAS